MNKEEILTKSRTGGMDERELMVEKDSFGFSMAVILLMVFVFGGWQLLHGVKSYELLSIAMGYTAANGIYKYTKLHIKRYLISGIISSVLAIVMAVLFFLGR